MKFKTISLLTCFVILVFTSCKKNNERTIETLSSCDSSNTTFNKIYNKLVNAASFTDQITMDLETHSYNFEVLSNKTICRIGYQSVPVYKATPYLIEIYDNTLGSAIYSDSSTFSSTATSYISIAPVQVLVGHSYTIKRVQTTRGNDLSSIIGRIVSAPSNTTINFPLVLDDLKITGSSFYGKGGPADNHNIPYIDIVFQ